MLRNITLSADEGLIEQARVRARGQNTTLNAAFRRWLEQFAAEQGARAGFDALMVRLDGVESGRRFHRDEMNER